MANLSRSVTIAEALRRLNLLRQQDVLRIHVIGCCHHVECDIQERIRTLFGPIVRWIGANAHSPDCLVTFDWTGYSSERRGAVSSESRAQHHQWRKHLEQGQVSCQNTVYDEWSLTQRDDCAAHLVVAFNTKEWRKTICAHGSKSH